MVLLKCHQVSWSNISFLCYQLILQVVMLILVVSNHVLAEELEAYLSSQLSKTEREIVKSLTEKQEFSHTGQPLFWKFLEKNCENLNAGLDAIEFSTPKKIIFPKDYGPATVFSLFDNVYVLMGIDLYYFVPTNDPVYLGVNQHRHKFSNIVDHTISFIKVAMLLIILNHYHQMWCFFKR